MAMANGWKRNYSPERKVTSDSGNGCLEPSYVTPWSPTLSLEEIREAAIRDLNITQKEMVATASGTLPQPLPPTKGSA